MITIKIIAEDLKDKNIRMHCDCCNCVYELETRDDFKIHWVYKPVKEWYDHKTMIPEYSIICPNCGYEVNIEDGLIKVVLHEIINEVPLLKDYGTTPKVN